MSDGTITVNEASIAVEFRQGFGIHVSGLEGFPAREILLRTIKALASSGCIIGNRKISTKVDTGYDTAHERQYLMTELFDFPLAVAIMQELGFAKFKNDYRIRYVGMLRPDGRIELLDPAVFAECHERVFLDNELVCANNLWKEANIDPGHVYLTTFRRLHNIAAEEKKSERG